MAACRQRGLGRAVSGGTGSAALPWDDFADGVAGTVTLRTGGTPGGSGLVLVTGRALAWPTSETACPCQITAWLETSASDERSGPVDHNFGYIQGGTPMTALATSHVFVVPTATTVSFVLGGEIEGPNFPLAPRVSTFLRWNMSAVYFSFDAEGTNPKPFAPAA